MAWDTGSIKISNPQFRGLGFRLLLSYLGVMVAIGSVSATAVYQLVARNLNREVNDHLLLLAEAAAETIEIIKHEYYDEHEEENYQENLRKADTNANIAYLMAEYGRDGALYVPAKHPLDRYQGVEWFDEKQQFLIREGNLAPDWSLQENLNNGNLILQKGSTRSLALPVYYLPKHSQEQEIAGYIRASESTEWLELELEQLLWNMIFGGIIALALTAVGGLWLTRLSLQPIELMFQQLKQFTADASHELRSPLTAIKSSISVLQNHPERIDPADVKKVAAIASAANQMTHLMNDLLFLARMEGTRATLTLEKRPIPVEEMLEDLLDELELDAEAKQITLESKLLGNVLVNADGEQLKRLFLNLLENALQYTPAGGKVKVSLFTSREQATVSFEDSGIGIAQEDLPRIFDRLWRSEKAKVCRDEGTGLGMAIAQSIARAHGGEITVTSELGVGSCFQVQLPLKPTFRT